MAAAAFANMPAGAQTFQNGSYYANPSWDQQIPTAQRFVVLSNWGNAAVLDRETGLVWQRAPQVPDRARHYFDAVDECWETNTGGRKGWRLPPEELLSLIDPAQSNPALPAANPFQQVLPSGVYWSAGTVSTTNQGGFVFNVSRGFIGIADHGGFFAGVWCVRGGSHVLTDLEP
jgi:hypothetical protein